MDELLRAAGLADAPTRWHEVDGERFPVVRLSGSAEPVRQRVRALSTAHYPVLMVDMMHLDRDFFRVDGQLSTPADVLRRAETADLDAYLARWPAGQEELGTGEEGYFLDAYDVTAYGAPQFLAILPRPEPWAAFAYVDAYGGLALPPELMVVAARRWHERHGAEPTVIGLATGFTVAHPPALLVDAERLAAEHVCLAGLTAGTTIRAYAKALTELDHWTLYSRP
ncbi:DUF4253 domain-containing protein [Dactylosporangium siamense]|uniref:DUF4253 domain-containing protein n=1 Tax=Dactylosporangium siamense TaxID=685454 RepID=A0A919UDY6_9ACTN|nr:DUF4253 domain-containing protein [Dactylosporangium siamense]GIG48446.1 hypothetical protein Dsi01nite_064870 [Dactylosporangium siamense]